MAVCQYRSVLPRWHPHRFQRLLRYDRTFSVSSTSTSESITVCRTTSSRLSGRSNDVSNCIWWYRGKPLHHCLHLQRRLTSSLFSVWITTNLRRAVAVPIKGVSIVAPFPALPKSGEQLLYFIYPVNLRLTFGLDLPAVMAPLVKFIRVNPASI